MMRHDEGILRKKNETNKKQQSYWLITVIIIVAPILLFFFVDRGAIGSPSNNDVTSKVGKIEDPKRAGVWTKISNKLCPAMVPQTTKYARHLFQLAQMEVLKGNLSQESEATLMNCTALSEQNRKFTGGDEFAIRFFEHPRAWDTFSYLDPGKRQFFSFLSIWKCANTQIRKFHQQIFNTSVSFQARFNTSRLIKNPNFTKKKQQAKLSDCIVAVIRDPISHFLSGYNEIEFRINVEIKDPREMIAREWPFGWKTPGSTERFEQFVIDLVTCPIAKQLPGIVDEYPNLLELPHIYSMSAILRLMAYYPSGKRNFHYLPTLANLNETWPSFVLDSCPTAFTESTKAKFLTTPMRGERWHSSSNDPLGTYKAAKTVTEKEGPVAKALCALHMMDYACWQDLPDGVPKVCMDLYLDYHSRNMLL